jgi:hypothetical protein
MEIHRDGDMEMQNAAIVPQAIVREGHVAGQMDDDAESFSVRWTQLS